MLLHVHVQSVLECEYSVLSTPPANSIRYEEDKQVQLTAVFNTSILYKGQLTSAGLHPRSLDVSVPCVRELAGFFFFFFFFLGGGGHRAVCTLDQLSPKKFSLLQFCQLQLKDNLLFLHRAAVHTIVARNVEVSEGTQLPADALCPEHQRVQRMRPKCPGNNSRQDLYVEFAKGVGGQVEVMSTKRWEQWRFSRGL